MCLYKDLLIYDTLNILGLYKVEYLLIIIKHSFKNTGKHMIEFSTTLDDLMMAQQPILKKTKETFGYELLFRGKDPLNANVSDGKTATSQVLVNLCIGITKMESQLRKPFFVNMTTELMLSDAFFPINPGTVYIEILEKQKSHQNFLLL